MKYKDLLKHLQSMSESQLEDNARVYEPRKKEYISIIEIHEVKHGKYHPHKAKQTFDDGQTYFNLAA
jgi:hypothetical protein